VQGWNFSNGKTGAASFKIPLALGPSFSLRFSLRLHLLGDETVQLPI
jgi:hypothetical protein